MSEKITGKHLQRKAVLYIRQSSPYQVVHHTEGRRLQYTMKERLEQLGWKEIEILDEDLGHTASGVEARAGFERMVVEVSLGKVGAVAAREVSRFARNSRDWQQLIEVCRIVDTLLIDHETVYDPRRGNDRLLLGLKGSLNEYELDLLRHRAQEARQEKARRGELFLPPPVGYLQGETSYERDPDLRVQKAVEQLFSRLMELGSVRQVLFWYIEQGLTLPVRHATATGWQTEWRRPNYSMIYRMVTHPIYGGAYAWGKTQTQVVWDPNAARQVKQIRQREEWLVLLPNRHEGYVSWEQFQRIQQMISSNLMGAAPDSPGAAKKGAALLAGLLRCRRCGRKLIVYYTGGGHNVLRYICARAQLDNGQPRCISLGGAGIDEAVSRELLKVLRPAAVKAAFATAQQQMGRQNQVVATLSLELQAARYTAARAAKQYDAADPENRLVADELERRWNRALEQVSRIEARIAQEELSQRARSLPTEESISGLASQLEVIWQDSETDVRLKKRLLRTLIKEIVVDVSPEAGEILVTIHWQGGVHTELKVMRRRSGETRRQAAPSIVEAVELLLRICTDAQIAGVLNRHDLRTGQGNYWTVERVVSLRKVRNIPAFSPERRELEGWLNLTQAAAFLGVSGRTLRLSAERGEVPALHPLPKSPWIFKRDDLQQPKASELVRRAKYHRCGTIEPDPRQQSLSYSTT
jgi:DNA invertase Pin-like site-specific DNA recombinase